MPESNRSPREFSDLALRRGLKGFDGDGGNRTRATFPPSPLPETPASTRILAALDGHEAGDLRPVKQRKGA